ncbi:glycosyltransferase family 4 protein [Candidatus Bathyarchaeota archaeon]|nr:glycosyltransferase family 4 protein [Candidatus Bathyarchaeota archaeon]
MKKRSSDRNKARVLRPNADRKLTFILPKISYEGVAKVGLMEASLLRTQFGYDVEIVSLIRENQCFRELLDNLKVRYASKFEVVSRVLYMFLARFMELESNTIVSHNIPATVLANRLAKKNKGSYIAYIHDAGFKRIPGSLPLFRHDKIKKALDNSASIFTNSLKTLKELRKQYAIDGLPLYPGCVRTEQVNDDKDDFFLFVHFISPRNAFRFLADLLRKESFNLVIAGGRRRGWEKVFESYRGFGNKVKFIFEPTETELARLYQRARGLIFPEMENFGLSPLEAAANGCPSVVARGSGVLEILEEGNEILALNEGDTRGFTEAIQILSEDAKYACQLGKRAWTKAGKHSWDAHVSKLADSLRISSTPPN